MVVFLNARAEHPRLQLRVQATRHVMMVEGFNTDLLDAEGDTRLAQQWTSLLLGDYTAFYLAMTYGVDPTPVAAIESLKASLMEG
jgi:glucose/mannose-6-phosphate isomerase